eukprot:c48078_g1_i1 orf=20-295(-)
MVYLQEHRLDDWGVSSLGVSNPSMDWFNASKKQGVGGSTILVRRDWRPKLAFAHPEGQAVAVEIARKGCLFLVASIYAPNVKKNGADCGNG